MGENFHFILVLKLELVYMYTYHADVITTIYPNTNSNTNSNPNLKPNLKKYCFTTIIMKKILVRKKGIDIHRSYDV